MDGKDRTPSAAAVSDSLVAANGDLGGVLHDGGHPEGHGQAGADSRGREQLSDIQRARIVAAMMDVAAEVGAGNATVARVVARSGVSRRTFYELFDDREDCFLAAFDEGVARASRYVLDAYDPQARWAERIRTALTGLLTFLTYERGVGQLLIVETLGAGPQALARRQRVLAQIITAVDTGRTEVKGGDGPPPLTAEGVVGAVLSIVHTRMVAADSPPLVELAGALTSMLVLPYLGPAAARRELQRPAAQNGRPARGAGANPLKDLDMRLTYRTVRVLMAIGAHPGVSNRRVGDAAGVSDQGQISKLLARLDHLGLIENSGFGQAKGESNSWFLTERGRQIEGAIREQTTEKP
jgi:AcrR family transcriptional regulator/DNA-binding MarR family transcriptional regulator